MDFQGVQTSSLRAVIVVAGSLLVGACIRGDPITSHAINVAFPDTEKEQVVPLLLDAGQARNYRRAGRWEVGGLPMHETCKGAVDIDTCTKKFLANAHWKERDEQRTASTIRFSFSVVRPDRVIELEPEVTITAAGRGSQAKIEFIEFTPAPSAPLIAEFHALKRLLVERYGAMVTTQDEPKVGP